MEPRLLRIFQEQVALQCRFALQAYSKIGPALTTHQHEAVSFWIEAFLNATANISKALWGQGGKKAQDRESLRQSIGVADSSPLQITDMRNHFEHFDERLERWWDTSTGHAYLDLNITSRDALVIDTGVTDIDYFRFLDPSTGDVRFWSDTYNLPAIAQEIQRILPIVSAEAAKPHWEP